MFKALILETKFFSLNRITSSFLYLVEIVMFHSLNYYPSHLIQQKVLYDTKLYEKNSYIKGIKCQLIDGNQV